MGVTQQEAWQFQAMQVASKAKPRLESNGIEHSQDMQSTDIDWSCFFRFFTPPQGMGN